MLPNKLQIDYIPKSKLKRLDGNPRKVKDKDAIKKLQKLIESHGFQNPLQVYAENNGDFSILCGNHRFEAGCAAGMTDFPCIQYFGDREQALARALSDNKSSDWTEWDIPLLKDVLAELDTGAFDIEELTGFSDADINELMGNIKSDDLNDDVPDDKYKEQYGVIVICESEAHQEEIFNKLSSNGYNVKVVVT